MQKLKKELYDISEMLEEELAKTNKKLEKSGGQMTAGDLDYVDKLTRALKSVKTTCAMLEAEDGEWSHDYDMRGSSYAMDGNSMARGRDRGVKRDSMGRYSFRMNYSRDDDMIMELKKLMESAPEHVRGEFQRFISKVESM